MRVSSLPIVLGVLLLTFSSAGAARPHPGPAEPRSRVAVVSPVAPSDDASPDLESPEAAPDVFVDDAKGDFLANVHESPDGMSPRVAQAILGDCLQVLDYVGAWIHVRQSDQGEYEGWVRRETVGIASESFLEARRSDALWIVIGAENAAELPMAAILPGARRHFQVELVLPSGRRLAVDDADVQPLAASARPQETLARLRELASQRSVMFQRGGNSQFEMDDAGLVYLFYRLCGAKVPRSAVDQGRAGTVVETPLAGDLLRSRRARTSIGAIVAEDGKMVLVALPEFGTLRLVASSEVGSNVSSRRVLDPRDAAPPSARFGTQRPSGATISRLRQATGVMIALALVLETAAGISLCLRRRERRRLGSPKSGRSTWFLL